MDKLKMRILLNEVSEIFSRYTHFGECIGEFTACKGCDFERERVIPLHERVEVAIKELREEK